jgi:membrane protein YdbS with pleckstrin-like domain
MKKEKYLEKVFREHEERYCAKHGRNKFLKSMPRRVVYYMIASTLSFIIGVTILVLGINNIKFLHFSPRNLIISGAMIVLAIIVMTFLILPPYWRLSQKCKAEQKQLNNVDASKN